MLFKDISNQELSLLLALQFRAALTMWEIVRRSRGTKMHRELHYRLWVTYYSDCADPTNFSASCSHTRHDKEDGQVPGRACSGAGYKGDHKQMARTATLVEKASLMPWGMKVLYVRENMRKHGSFKILLCLETKMVFASPFHIQ